MAANANCDAALLGKFHPNCGKVVELSKDRRTASGYYTYAFSIAFSNDPIAEGLRFSVKISQHSTPPVWLGIGVTTKDPDSKPLPQEWVDINKSDKYWYVLIGSGEHTANHNGEARPLQWGLDHSAGNTIGCRIVQAGELHLYHDGRDLGVIWAGLPDQPLWGFVTLCGLKVEANYIAAKAGHRQDYASKTLHFVEKPPERLICAVCRTLAHVPMQANCCGTICCTPCMERQKTRSNCCPGCRNTEHSDPPFNVFTDRNAHQCIVGLAVYCPNQCDGCNKKINLSEVENHLTSENGCPFHTVDCDNQCGHKESRATMQKHMTSECHLRQKKCQYCPLNSTYEDVTGAHLEVCPNYPLDCPNKCSTEGVTRSTLPAHREECPLQQVECEYKQFGCAAILQRKSVVDHMKTSVHSHLQMTKSNVMEQQVYLHEQKARLQEQEARLQEQEAHLQEQEEHIQREERHREGLEARLLKIETTMAHMADKV